VVFSNYTDKNEIIIQPLRRWPLLPSFWSTRFFECRTSGGLFAIQSYSSIPQGVKLERRTEANQEIYQYHIQTEGEAEVDWYGR